MTFIRTELQNHKIMNSLFFKLLVPEFNAQCTVRKSKTLYAPMMLPAVGNYAIHGACLRMVLLMDICRNLTSL